MFSRITFKLVVKPVYWVVIFLLTFFLLIGGEAVLWH